MNIGRLIGLLVVSIVGLVLTGCVNSTCSRVVGINFDPVPDSVDVRVYANEVPDGMEGILSSRSVPAGTKVGTVTMDGAEGASWNSVISKAKKEARKMGGDALVVEQWSYTPKTAGYADSGGVIIPVSTTRKAFVAAVYRVR